MGGRRGAVRRGGLSGRHLVRQACGLLLSQIHLSTSSGLRAFRAYGRAFAARDAAAAHAARRKRRRRRRRGLGVCRFLRHVRTDVMRVLRASRAALAERASRPSDGVSLLDMCDVLGPLFAVASLAIDVQANIDLEKPPSTAAHPYSPMPSFLGYECRGASHVAPALSDLSAPQAPCSPRLA